MNKFKEGDNIVVTYVGGIQQNVVYIGPSCQYPDSVAIKHGDGTISLIHPMYLSHKKKKVTVTMQDWYDHREKIFSSYPERYRPDGLLYMQMTGEPYTKTFEVPE